VERIGITTTIPSEVLFAAGTVPVDLNNIFINSDRRNEYIKRAEHDGYPRNVCGWIKGIYGVLACESDIRTVVAVTQGDCSNTHALMETLQLKGVKTIPFAYPYNRDPETLHREIISLASHFGTNIEAAEQIQKEMEPARALLDRLDEITWQKNHITGSENHLWLVSSSDFNGDFKKFENELADYLETAGDRTIPEKSVRLAFIGVPPILDDLHGVVEDFGGRVVFNEVQRQFSMPERSGGLVEQYLAYTYPYSIFHRLDYIIPELERRRIDGVIHYVQSFCHRHIEDLIIRKKCSIPVLTIEGESPGKMDARTKIRLQAFIEMLERGRNDDHRYNNAHKE